MNNGDLARLLGLIADSLERQQQSASAGCLREAARRLVEGSNANRCPQCGKDLSWKGTGREPVFCSSACRLRSYRATKGRESPYARLVRSS